MSRFSWFTVYYNTITFWFAVAHLDIPPSISFVYPKQEQLSERTFDLLSLESIKLCL